MSKHIDEYDDKLKEFREELFTKVSILLSDFASSMYAMGYLHSKEDKGVDYSRPPIIGVPTTKTGEEEQKEKLDKWLNDMNFADDKEEQG